MKNENRFLVIVPAYNEETRITKVVLGLRENIGDKGDIVIIDDGSSDKTADKASTAGASVIQLPFNLGYGAALKTGYRYALKQQYDIVVQIDGDGQHDSSVILDIMKPILTGTAHVVIGSRYLGKTSYKIPIARSIGHWIFSGILRYLTGKRVTDPTSGFQALSNKVLKLYVSDEFPSDYPDADVLLLLYYKGYYFQEIPAFFHGAEGSPSIHGGLKPIYYIYKMLLSLFLVGCRYRFKKVS